MRRPTLLGTVCASLLFADQARLLGYGWGRPVWEFMPDGPESHAVDNATQSYLGRLVPISRVIRLAHDGSGMMLGAALEYRPDWREVAATWVVRERNGKEERMPMSASLFRGLWREAHAIAVATASERQALGGPPALMAVAESREDADVWCGALVANKSKLLDAVESVLHIPAPMFADQGQRLYREGVDRAERWGRRIGRAISAYRRAMKDDLDRKESRNRGNLVKRKAATHYWTAVEQKLRLLLGLLDDPSPLRPDGADRDMWGDTPWGAALVAAAREAYELACPRDTPRQLRAYVMGLRTLFHSGGSSPDEESAGREDKE